MEPLEPTTEQFVDVASAIDVGDTAAALAAVQQRVVGRRRRRRAATGVLVSAMLVTGGVVAINNFNGRDGDNALSIGASETTDVPETTDVAEPVTTDGATNPDAAPAAAPVVEAVPAGAVEIIDTTATSVQITGPVDPFENGWVDWLVPWRDGFLVGRTSQTPQALPESLPEEVVALFPQEVVDFFDGELPPTINEAIDMLTDAGLLDEVTAVINENPEAFDAVYSEPVPESAFDVFFSTDGSEWEQVPFTNPDGSAWLASVQSVGDRLVAMSQGQPDFSVAPGPLTIPDSTGPVVVSSTTDLVNWDVIEVPVAPRPVGLPDVFSYNVHPQSLVVNPTGWVVTVYEDSQVRPDRLLPPDVFERVTNGEFGYGTSTDATGITLTIDGPYVPEFDPNGVPTGPQPEPAEEFSFTWEELGVVDDVTAWIEQGPGVQIWAAPWGGTPLKADEVIGSSIVGSTDGFYSSTNNLLYSPDGVTWNTLEVPGEVYGVQALLPVDGGVIAMIAGPDGVDFYRVSSAGATWVLLDIPGLPDSLSNSFGGLSPSASAIVVDASPGRTPPPITVTFESDGFVLTIRESYPSGNVTLVDPEGVTILDETRDLNSRTGLDVIQFNPEAVEIFDPDSGEVLFSVDPEVFQAAYSAQYDEISFGAEEYRPDMWLIATTDGQRWLIEDLVDDENGESYFGPASLAVNGDTLLINLGEEWVTYDLS